MRGWGEKGAGKGPRSFSAYNRARGIWMQIQSRSGEFCNVILPVAGDVFNSWTIRALKASRPVKVFRQIKLARARWILEENPILCTENTAQENTA